MTPDCVGWWWYRPLGWTAWKPSKVFPVGSDLKFNSNSFTILKVSDAPGQWGGRLYAPDEYPRYLRLTGEPVSVTHTSANGRINADFDKDGFVVGLEILYAEGGK